MLAPPGSRRDVWIRQANFALMKLRESSIKAILLRIIPPILAKPLRKSIRRARGARYARLLDEFHQILQQHGSSATVILFPPSLDWQTQLFQRPQHLALALARQGALVFYFQPPNVKSVENFQPIEKGLYLCNFPAEALGGLNKPYLYLLTWNRTYADVFQSPRIIYDYVDEIDVFAGHPRKLRREHEALLQRAELVMATARRLYEQALPLRPDTLLCPNGVDYEIFAHYRQLPFIQPPADLTPILERKKPVIGYYGALATWFDYSLLRKVAAHRSDLTFVLVGPDYDGTLPPDLLNLPNVEWLGVKPYEQIPIYLHFFDVATIPFKVNDVTHAVSPLKLFEYMAGGKPVVVTPMRESAGYPGVLIASSPEEFSAQLDKALELREDQAYLSTIDTVARENTWAVRAQQILKALRS